MALMICGVPRSGTTLLRRLCDGHPDVAVTYETRVFAFPAKPLHVHARNISVNLARRSIAGWRSGRRDLFWPRVGFLTRYLAALGAARRPWSMPEPARSRCVGCFLTRVSSVTSTLGMCSISMCTPTTSSCPAS